MSLPIKIKKSKKLRGEIILPGDRAVSHRALITASMAVGESVLNGLFEGEDVLRTAMALRALGVDIQRRDDGWHVFGVGVGGLTEPEDVIDIGYSGTALRLMMGLVAPYGFLTFFNGAPGLGAKSIQRLRAPLEEMGVRLLARQDTRLPLAVRGNSRAMPLHYQLPLNSSQIKSSLLLAALNVPGTTVLLEEQPGRDHTERMLRFFGADLDVKEIHDGKMREIRIRGQQEFITRQLKIAGDPSLAAYFAMAALLAEKSELLIREVCTNPWRAGLFSVLQRMGANLKFFNEDHYAHESDPEPRADILASHSTLHAIDVTADELMTMMDEYPLLVVAAACAKGVTTIPILPHLQPFEYERFQEIMNAMTMMGVKIERGASHWAIHGLGKAPQGGVVFQNVKDYRVAMALTILGLASDDPITLGDVTMAQLRFPGFFDQLGLRGGIFRYV